MKTSRVTLTLLIVISLGMGVAKAEPWIAVKTGYNCSMCHTNPNGGGMRTEFGNAWAQMNMSARPISDDSKPWSGLLGPGLRIGGNVRADTTYHTIDGQEDRADMALSEGRVYLQIQPLPDLEIYFDQRIAPGGSLNREAYARHWFGERQWYIAAGRMYLPYGLRLEDDSAFVKQISGLNFTTPDTAVLLGREARQWNLQLVVSEGAQSLRGKALTARAEFVHSAWRGGASIHSNQTDFGERNMLSVFGGFRTGNIGWLAEIGRVEDTSLPDQSQEHDIGLLEANWFWRDGHNLKLTTELWQSDMGSTSRRQSMVWEYTPWPFTQIRVGGRVLSGRDIQEHELLFLQLHAFF
ncbi:hypothetical protein FM042_06855 [Aliidiomarina halalkaliphila]|uniref:Cytochrome c domain-containing protein n=1 Tax=Aliidiomarina halalkaliphila TaxID=2593535 RepID=A0A552X0X7_9GAMM|nr:hypothetical protein [Aliidiomarina halalkaliphila]TRW48700.1 hypothetical protein FM042_06855 [Aliidiomarina halalkaliphila]